VHEPLEIRKKLACAARQAARTGAFVARHDVVYDFSPNEGPESFGSFPRQLISDTPGGGLTLGENDK